MRTCSALARALPPIMVIILLAWNSEASNPRCELIRQEIYRLSAGAGWGDLARIQQLNNQYYACLQEGPAPPPVERRTEPPPSTEPDWSNEAKRRALEEQLRKENEEISKAVKEHYRKKLEKQRKAALEKRQQAEKENMNRLKNDAKGVRDKTTRERIDRQTVLLDKAAGDRNKSAEQSYRKILQDLKRNSLLKKLNQAPPNAGSALSKTTARQPAAAVLSKPEHKSPPTTPVLAKPVPNRVAQPKTASASQALPSSRIQYWLRGLSTSNDSKSPRGKQAEQERKAEAKKVLEEERQQELAEQAALDEKLQRGDFLGIGKLLGKTRRFLRSAKNVQKPDGNQGTANQNGSGESAAGPSKSVPGCRILGIPVPLDFGGCGAHKEGQKVQLPPYEPDGPKTYK
ncbi:MAG: hypothetical protein QGI06_09435 [Rhodospirillales bacterium]|nr:hypothetical protein [Rhodospirillales bacterium]